MSPLQKVLAVALFPWATSWRIRGCVINEALELLEELRAPRR